MADHLDEAVFQLRRVLSIHASDASLEHRWIWEQDRWQELAFALLSRVVDLPEAIVREAVHHLDALDLLDIADLAIPPSRDERRDDLGRRIRRLLEQAGFTEAESLGGVTVLREAASAIEKHFGGKLQRYLRQYGEQMLKDVSRFFQFTALDDSRAADAFCYWLQNVSNMPLSLETAFRQRFCAQHGFSEGDLLRAADSLDVNFALLDDVVAMEMSGADPDATLVTSEPKPRRKARKVSQRRKKPRRL